MGRHDNADLTGLDINELGYDTIYVNEKGDLGNVDDHCAKAIVNQTDGATRYFIRYGNDSLYNPDTMTPREKQKILWKMKKVNETVYDLYTRYLKTRTKGLLLNAERRM